MGQKEGASGDRETSVPENRASLDQQQDHELERLTEAEAAVLDRYRKSEGILRILQPGIVGIVIAKGDGSVLHVSSTWPVNPLEFKPVIAAWQGGNSISVMLQGIKFSTLQSTKKRFISTNIKKQGHLVGVVTAEGFIALSMTRPEAAYDEVCLDLLKVFHPQEYKSHGRPDDVTELPALVSWSSIWKELIASLQTLLGLAGEDDGKEHVITTTRKTRDEWRILLLRLQTIL